MLDLFCGGAVGPARPSYAVPQGPCTVPIKHILGATSFRAKYVLFIDTWTLRESGQELLLSALRIALGQMKRKAAAAQE